MTLILLAALALSSPQAKAPEPEVEEIVVTARANRKCEIRFADKAMTDLEFEQRAKGWAAGTPVRVVARYDADIDCLSRIAFRLASRGVTRITYVDPQGRPAQPIRGKTDTAPTPRPVAPVGAAAPTDVGDIERRFFARQAAQLILEGKCAEARKLVLEAGDLASAAYVTTICGQAVRP